MANCTVNILYIIRWYIKHLFDYSETVRNSPLAYYTNFSGVHTHRFFYYYLKLVNLKYFEQ